MRAILVIVVIVLLLAAVGWISFSGGWGERPSVTVETDKIEQDIEAGKEALSGAIKSESDPAPAPEQPAPVVAPGASPN